MQADILFACTILLVALCFCEKTKWVVWAGSILAVLNLVQVILSPFHIL